VFIVSLYGTLTMNSDWSEAVMSTSAVVHADHGYSGAERRVPQFLARDLFNNWGLRSMHTTTDGPG
jgi:alpha-1,3-glucan synthase